MRTHSALLQTEDEIARPPEQVEEKRNAGTPPNTPDPPGQSGENQRGEQLRRADPCSDGGTQLDVAHSHAPHQEENAEDQSAEHQTAEALTGPRPAMKAGGDYAPAAHQ